MIVLTVPPRHHDRKLTNGSSHRVEVAEDINIPAGHVAWLVAPAIEIENGYPIKRCTVIPGSEFITEDQSKPTLFVRNDNRSSFMLKAGDPVARVLFIKVGGATSTGSSSSSSKSSSSKASGGTGQSLSSDGSSAPSSKSATSGSKRASKKKKVTKKKS